MTTTVNERFHEVKKRLAELSASNYQMTKAVFDEFSAIKDNLKGLLEIEGAPKGNIELELEAVSAQITWMSDWVIKNNQKWLDE